MELERIKELLDNPETFKGASKEELEELRDLMEPVERVYTVTPPSK